MRRLLEAWSVTILLASLWAPIGCTPAATAACLGSSTDCNGTCVELQRDPLNCGACGTACPSGEVCSGGTCAVSCQAGLTNCNGKCIDPTRDPTYCGASGVCTGASAGTTCPSGEVCSGGTCGVSCQAGLVNCNGTCVNPLTDRSFCGASGTCSATATPPTSGQVCPSGHVCSGGGCALSCQAGLTNCAGTCANTATDNLNCGACGAACPSGEVCSGGTCAVSCPSGEVACNGSCANPASDPSYCGVGAGCSGGAACGPSAACYAGACEPLCPAGEVMCAGSCIDPTTSMTNCGASGYCTGTSAGQACTTGQTCVAGVCTPPPCVWTTVASYPLNVQPAGSATINGAMGGQAVGVIGGRTGWVQMSDWNALYLSPGVSADVFSTEVDFFIAPGQTSGPYAVLESFEQLGAVWCPPWTEYLSGGVTARIDDPASGTPTFTWRDQGAPGACVPTTATDTKSISSPAGAWHHLKVEGVRSICHFDISLDGATIATETGACNTTATDFALFGGSIVQGNAAQVGWANWTISTGSATSCVP